MQAARLICSGLLVLLASGWLSSAAMADEAAARAAMEDSTHPLLHIATTQGDIFVEMLPAEAPRNVARFVDLAEGRVTFTDPASGASYNPRYFDGMRFHRVIPGLLIQTGSPAKHPLGAPAEMLPDEINGAMLGLDTRFVFSDDNRLSPLLNVGTRQDLEQTLLQPLYRRMGIDENDELRSRQFEVAAALRQMTLQQAYENLGYRYDPTLISRPIERGIMALANQGPNSNGPEFFIATSTAPWLDGRHTVIGRVVDGMDVVDRINRFAMDPLTDDRQSTLIFSIRSR
jgi:cyclophilin family peptidyl-prolyl cis-trans isomerase